MVSAQLETGVTQGAAATIELTPGAGTPLSDSVRAPLETQLGADLADVRVHTDPRAEAAAAEVRARAFTLGKDIMFSRGAFAPETARGLELLAHELVHVVQSYGGDAIAHRDGPADDPEAKTARAYFESVEKTYNEEFENEPLGTHRARLHRRLLLFTKNPQATTWDEVAEAERDIDAAESEKDTVKILGTDIVDAVPEAFPETWADRLDTSFRAPLHISFARKGSDDAWAALQTRVTGLPTTLYPVGLPLSFAEAIELESFGVLKNHAALPYAHPVRDIANAGMRYLEAKYLLDIQLKWETLASNFVKSVRDGTAAITAESFQRFRMYISALSHPDRAVQSPVPLDVLNEFPADLEKIDVAFAKFASWMAFLDWFLGWPPVGTEFLRGLALTDDRVRNTDTFVRVALGQHWADLHDYADEAWSLIGQAVVEQLPEMLKETALFIALQFVPGVNIAVDIYAAVSALWDLASAVLDSAEAWWDAASSTTVVTLQRNIAEMILKDRANALRVAGDLLTIKASIKSIKVRAAKARAKVEPPPAPPTKGKVPTPVKPAAPAPAVHDPAFTKWESKLNNASREFLESHPQQAALYEVVEPSVRELLSPCTNPCPIVTAKQLALLERLVKSGKVKKSPKLQSFLRKSATDLDRALDDLDRAPDAAAIAAVLEGKAAPPPPRKLVPGQPEHKAQRWQDYQAKHPERFKKPTDKVDPKWSKQYDTVIKNKRSGGKFEQDSLTSLGLQKNEQVMIHDDFDSGGFIPDGVTGPRGGAVTALEWGKPYHFTEVKGWTDMSATGNLFAMMSYVQGSKGSFLTVVFRSAKHPSGETTLSGPLAGILDQLIADGKATITRFP